VQRVERGCVDGTARPPQRGGGGGARDAAAAAVDLHEGQQARRRSAACIGHRGSRRDRAGTQYRHSHGALSEGDLPRRAEPHGQRVAKGRREGRLRLVVQTQRAPEGPPGCAALARVASAGRVCPSSMQQPGAGADAITAVHVAEGDDAGVAAPHLPLHLHPPLPPRRCAGILPRIDGRRRSCVRCVLRRGRRWRRRRQGRGAHDWDWQERALVDKDREAARRRGNTRSPGCRPLGNAPVPPGGGSATSSQARHGTARVVTVPTRVRITTQGALQDDSIPTRFRVCSAGKRKSNCDREFRVRGATDRALMNTGLYNFLQRRLAHRGLEEHGLHSGNSGLRKRFSCGRRRRCGHFRRGCRKSCFVPEAPRPALDDARPSIT